MVELEQEGDMLLPAGAAPAAFAGGDPLDFFGAIRNLVESNIPAEDLRKYATPRREQKDVLSAFFARSSHQQRQQQPPPKATEFASGYPSAQSNDGSSQQQQQQQQQTMVVGENRHLAAENNLLRGKISELEVALQQAQDRSHQMVGRGCRCAIGDCCAFIWTCSQESLCFYTT